MTDKTAYPDDNPKTAQGALKIDLSLVPPSAIIAEARVMGLGAKKYGPYNWRDRTVSSRVYIAAAMRHLVTYLDGEDNDAESGESHLAHARACCGIIIDAKSLGKLNDNRPLPGAAGRLLVHTPVAVDTKAVVCVPASPPTGVSVAVARERVPVLQSACDALAFATAPRFGCSCETCSLVRNRAATGV